MAKYLVILTLLAGCGSSSSNTVDTIASHYKVDMYGVTEFQTIHDHTCIVVKNDQGDYGIRTIAMSCDWSKP